MTIRGTALAIALTLCAPAWAQETRDIPWFVRNHAARAATIRACQSDHSFDREVNCDNAETAEARVWAQRAARSARRIPTPEEMLESPTYWTENRMARVGAVAACTQGISTMPPGACAAAIRADREARNAR